MAEDTTTSETTLQIRRTFAAPRQKVFEAWTQLEKLTTWLCRVTEQHSTRILEFDARVGGRYRLEVTAPEAVASFFLVPTEKLSRPKGWSSPGSGKETRILERHWSQWNFTPAATQ